MKILQLASQYQSNLSDFGPVAKLLSEGKALLQELKTADTAQESKKLSDLPAKTAEFYYHKGLLYFGLKAIDAAGHALHAANPREAGRYNLFALYRQPKRAAKKPVPAPTDVSKA